MGIYLRTGKGTVSIEGEIVIGLAAIQRSLYIGPSLVGQNGQLRTAVF